jgi:hypothetical protein
MSDKRVRFEYHNASSYDYVVKLRNRRHYIYDRVYGMFGHTDKLIGFLKATARPGYKHIRIDDV